MLAHTALARIFSNRCVVRSLQDLKAAKKLRLPGQLKRSDKLIESNVKAQTPEVFPASVAVEDVQRAQGKVHQLTKASQQVPEPAPGENVGTHVDDAAFELVKNLLDARGEVFIGTVITYLLNHGFRGEMKE